MYNLVVDAGNTSIKMFLFDKGEIAHSLKCCAVEDLLSTLESAVPVNSIGKCIVSSVSVEQENIAAVFNPLFRVRLFDSKLRFPINIRYGTPGTLGSDRVAAVVGAYVRYPKRNILVIDSGTAITYDILTAEGEYLGGNISPGLNTRFRALHNFTGKLPLLQVDDSMEGLFGTNTNEAIGLGVQNGILYEVEATVREFSRRFNDFLLLHSSPL